MPSITSSSRQSAISRGAGRRATLALLTLLVSATVLTSYRVETASANAAPAQTKIGRPKLVVLLVVDQFRRDYIDQYGSQWNAGLRRLIAEGAVFTRAAYPYAITKTCAGHSTISTGTAPATHGMIDNEWWDRATQRTLVCTADPAAVPIPFGPGMPREHHSASLLRVPTFADELQRQRPETRVVSLALKPRSAIGLGGRGGPNATIVWEEDNGTWSTSTAFARVAPADVNEFVKANHQSTKRGQVWDRLLPPNAYRYDDAAPGEIVPQAFPHLLHGTTDGAFLDAWERSPYADAFIADLASLLVTERQLGQHDQRTDLLALSLAGLDYVGHHWGPRSHEVQDILIRLDRRLGQLFDHLDRTVGRDGYVMAFSSDHGVGVIPEQGESVTGARGGRIRSSDVGRVVELTLAARFGLQSFVEAATSTYVYFRPGVLERVQASEASMRAVELAVRNVPGIERTYWARDLASREPTSDRILAGLRKSYVPGRSGDLVYMPRPNWIVSGDEASHGSMHAYDTDVPLILYGFGVKPGKYNSARTPLDIAPTLASIVGISMPSAEGSVLTEALRK